MAQINDGGTIAGAREYEQYNSDEAIILSGSFAKVLTFDCMNIRESTLQFTNTGTGTEVVSYKIFATAKKAIDINAVGTDPETDDEWINILSTGVYDHTTETTIPIGDKTFETFSNPWRYIIVMAKSATGTPTLKIWHRGEN